MSDCSIEFESGNGYRIAKVSGDLGLGEVDEWLPELSNSISEPGSNLIIDLSRAGGIDSHALSRLVALVADGNTRSCRVLIAAPAAFIAGVLEVTRLDRFFEICETVAEAEARCTQA